MTDFDREQVKALWRVGSHYGIHVYDGDRPVATFHTVEDARQAVADHNATSMSDETPVLSCGCTSHNPADHQGHCGHCGANEDELCEVDCPVAGVDVRAYDGTTAEARVTRGGFGYTVNVHEHLLAYELPAWRLTRRGAQRKARRMLARWRRGAAAPEVVSVVR